MKLPYNKDYGVMKLPYSRGVFPSDLTGSEVGPAVPDWILEYFSQPEGNNIFMLWPSSWHYPDGCDPFLT